MLIFGLLSDVGLLVIRGLLLTCVALCGRTTLLVRRLLDVLLLIENGVIDSSWLGLFV